jgi:dTDP-4-amino-4,6-dideoxygalactose transaminase
VRIIQIIPSLAAGGLERVATTLTVALAVAGDDVTVCTRGATHHRANERALVDAGVETRRWWGDGAHRHPATEMFPRAPLPVTEMLARSTIAVPFYRDLSALQIQTVTGAVRSVLPVR